jgi:glycosyltransferase involved in cell wall biosynthesis
MESKFNPKVTILMSVYNSEKYLREAINSILGQTFKDFEFLIIDDGSKDGSVDIIRSYADPRIRFIQNDKNIGLTRSLNKGLKLARGEYIARMDGDDIALSDRLEKQVSFLDKYEDIKLVGSSYYEIDENDKVVGHVDCLTNNDDIQRRFLLPNNCFCHPSTMFRKECIEKVGTYREFFKYSQDYDLWRRIAEEYNVANIGEPLLKWRISHNSISSTAKTFQYAFHHMGIILAEQRRKYGKDSLGYCPEKKKYALLRQKNSNSLLVMLKMKCRWLWECAKLKIKLRFPKLVHLIKH